MDNIQLSDNYDGMIKGCVTAGVEYFKAHPKLKSMVIGISGGVDSAVVTFIARQICNKLRNLRLLGYSLPISGNKDDEKTRSIAVGYSYCDDFCVQDLTKSFASLLGEIDCDLCCSHEFHTLNTNTLSHEDKIRAGNIKARLRMIYLFNQASKNEGLVLSTDNLTEYHLGFWTLHGDVGNLGLIQNLWKTEVYGMGDAIGQAVGLCCAATPTDGLGITNSDLDQLLPGWQGDHRAGYKMVDDILIDYLDEKKTYDPSHPVLVRRQASEFKRKDPISIKRDALTWKFN